MKSKLKICRGISNKPLHILNESEMTNGKKYVFSGVFTACSTDKKKIINRNSRVYMDKEVLPHLSYLRDTIKQNGCLLGELDHPEGRFDIQLKEASHKIVDLWYDEKTACVMGKLELLDTPNGNIAKELVEAGYPLFVSSRAAGDVDEQTHEVEIAQIFTYDIVCTPGFAEARLQRVNESLSNKALKYINESATSKNNLDLIEPLDEFVVNEKIAKAISKPVKMSQLTQPLLEEDDNDFKLPEAETNPNEIDKSDDDKKEDKKSSSESDDKKKEVKDESPEKKKDLKKEEDISEEDEQDDKKSAILGIRGEDEDGDPISGDNTADKDTDKEINRAKILDITAEESSELLDPEAEEDAEVNDSGEEDNGGIDKETEEDVKEATEKKKKIVSDTEKTVDELDAMLDAVLKAENIKESIIRRYPFAISLSEQNFAKFAALRPNQKKKCSNFIDEHQIYDIKLINELWMTPLQQEKKVQQNWLKLASQEDIDLYVAAPKEVQDAIEESAKYVILETQDEVDEFWQRTGLRQIEARRRMNEQFVKNYKTSNSSPYDKNMNDENSNPLGYDIDFIKLTEDMMNM